MDTAQLESFVAVVDCASFTVAARQLHRSQPGVSRQIQRLEDELGAPLLRRAPGGVQLTEPGERFLAFARRTLDDLRALRSDLDATPTLHGRLTIAASTTPGQYLVPTLVGDFTTLHPGVEPEIAIMDSASAVQDVSSGACDVGFVGVQKHHSPLAYHVFAHDEVVLAVPRDHRFAGRASVSLDELENERFLDREQGSGTRDVVLQALRNGDQRLPTHRTAMVLSTTEAVVSAVQQGQGIGWVSYRALEGRDAGRVAIVRVRDKPIRRPLYLIHRRTAALPSPVREFVDWVRERSPVDEPAAASG